MEHKLPYRVDRVDRVDRVEGLTGLKVFIEMHAL